MPLTAAMIIQLFVDTFWLLDIGIVFSAIVMYSFVMSDQIEKELSYQREIADQRASIMILQMRPHFIYNTMTSIYCLCNQDPGRARQVTRTAAVLWQTALTTTRLAVQQAK